jgi:SHS2 domain-containing protein
MVESRKYRVLNRSSDLLIKVFGKSQAELFANSAFALFDLITDIQKVEVRERMTLEVEGINRDELMVNWMRELLYLYQGSGYLLREFLVEEAADERVRALVCGEKFDPDRHEIRREIRAVGYDRSRMEKTGEQWTAQVLFEI